MKSFLFIVKIKKYLLAFFVKTKFDRHINMNIYGIVSQFSPDSI